jgi:hypothetical protein
LQRASRMSLMPARIKALEEAMGMIKTGFGRPLILSRLVETPFDCGSRVRRMISKGTRCKARKVGNAIDVQCSSKCRQSRRPQRGVCKGC